MTPLIAPVQATKLLNPQNYDKIELAMYAKYGSVFYPIRRLREISRAMFKSEKTEALAGTEVLDVGCGSKTSSTRDFGDPGERIPEPWFCRVMKIIGAKRVVGIDIGSNAGEEFEHYKCNITEKDALGFLASGSFDLVNCENLLSNPLSPTLAYSILYMNRLISSKGNESRVRLKLDETAQFIYEHLSGEEKREVRESVEMTVKPRLFEEVSRVLRDDGWFFFEDQAFQKISGKLVDVRRAED